jgi:alpha-ketoglutarate-dependent taurine dioxygenase
MEKTKATDLNRKKFITARPKPIKLPQQQVKTDYLRPGEPLPFVITPAVEGLDLLDWVNGNKEFLEAELLRSGAILFRGFDVSAVPEFERFAMAFCKELVGDNGELPRLNISGKIYTPVNYPADTPILWHNENTFLPRWPMRIWFFCLLPALQGGETPIADSRKVLQSINPKIRDRFSEKRIMYMRNYGNGMGLNWQEVFQTTSRTEVEDYCRKHSIEFKWKGDDRLRTRSVRPAVASHPRTGEMVWFNQATHWHISCLVPAVRESLLAVLEEDDLPRNCYYGDGSPIEDSVMEEICDAFRRTEVCFPWQKSDILMLDNMLTAHARNPYVGERKIAVAMGDIIADTGLKWGGE